MFHPSLMLTKQLETTVSLDLSLIRNILRHNFLGIRANPNIGTIGFTNGINSAILRYEGVEDAEPPTVDITSTNPLRESSLVVSRLHMLIIKYASPFLSVSLLKTLVSQATPLLVVWMLLCTSTLHSYVFAIFAPMTTK
jgi:hypothetical protein